MGIFWYDCVACAEWVYSVFEGASERRSRPAKLQCAERSAGHASTMGIDKVTTSIATQ